MPACLDHLQPYQTTRCVSIRPLDRPNENMCGADWLKPFVILHTSAGATHPQVCHARRHPGKHESLIIARCTFLTWGFSSSRAGTTGSQTP